MNCQRILQDEIAERYLRDELDPPQQDEFEVHILNCRTCLESVEALQEMREALRERAHDIRVASPVHSSRGWYWAFAAAALLVVVGFSLHQWRHRTGTATEVTRLTNPAQQTQASPVATEPANAADQLSAVTSRPVSKKVTGPAAEPQVLAQESAPEIPKPSEGAEGRALQPQLPIVAESRSEPVRQIRKDEPELTQEQAVELYKLAEIRPEPYSFTGLAGNGKFNAAPGKAAVPGGGTGTGPGRTAFSDGMVAYVDGDYAHAARLLESAAAREPRAPDINFYRGVCSLLLGHPDDALPALAEVIREGKSQLVQPAHIYLARAYLQKMNLKTAEAELEAASIIAGPRKHEAKTLLDRVRSLRTNVESTQSNPAK